MYSEITVTEWVQFNQKSGSLRVCQQKSTTEKSADVSVFVQSLTLCVAWLI